LFGSNNMLEIAINQGNAASLLGIGWNHTVFVNID
jgi:S-adenosylmethionine hydrolase